MKKLADHETDTLHPTVPLLPELERYSFTSLAAGALVSMDEFASVITRRALNIMSSDSLDEYDSDSLDPLGESGGLCRLPPLASLHSGSVDPILHDHSLEDDADSDSDNIMSYTELRCCDREFSPGSVGDNSFGEQDHLSDYSSSEGGLESPTETVRWETIAECHIDVDGPLPPVSDFFTQRMSKDDYFIPMLIKTEIPDVPEDPMDCSLPLSHPPSLHLTAHRYNPTPTPATTTTNNSNHHDYTSANVSVDSHNNYAKTAGRAWGHRRCESGGYASENSSYRSSSPGAASLEKSPRKKPGRKKGQVSKVLHLWEFIRDLLCDPAYCPKIINWENEAEGVFRVTQSSEVARLWGEKKKNKKTMTYEKLSRSLRYSRKEGYFDNLPKDRGYPKKLCFKFGPKSHGWNEYRTR